MPYINLAGFSGEYPRTGPTNLAPNQAQIASNTKIQSGEIRPWRAPLLTYTPATTNTQTIFKFSGPANRPAVWLEWTSDVDVVSGLVADTSDYRLYFSSESFAPRKTNWLLATGNDIGVAPFPNNYYELGVPAPTAACSASVAGTGEAPQETRAYVYTYVTQFGSVLEESAPSPAVITTCNYSGDSVTLSGFASPATGNYNFQYIRIYRSVTGANSVGYQFVAQIPVAQANYVDVLTTASLSEPLTSLYYTPPPTGLRGLVAMPNGMMAGFVGNQVWFCEPYLPHAWPEKYMLTTEYPIVGLGVFNNTLVVGTTKHPYAISGSTPDSMYQEKLPLPQPCVSKRSIVSDQYGVMYASPNGLVSIGQGTNDVITQSLYTRDEWVDLASETFVSTIYNNMYIGAYLKSGVRKAIVILRGDNPPLSKLDIDAKAMFVERSTSSVYYLSATDNKIYQIDGSTTSNMLYEWKSKKFVLPSPANFATLKMQADYVYMAALAGRYITVTIYADGVQVYSGNVTSQEPIRLPVSTKAYVWEVKFNGNTPLRAFHMATSIGELRALTNG